MSWLLYGMLGVIMSGFAFIAFLIFKSIFMNPYKVILHRGMEEITARAKVVKVKGRGTWLQINKDKNAVFPFPPSEYWRRSGRFKDVVHVQSDEPGSYVPIIIQLPKIRHLTTDDRELMYAMEENITQLEKSGTDWGSVITKALPFMVVMLAIIGLYFTYDMGIPELRSGLVDTIHAQSEAARNDMNAWRDAITAIQTNLTTLDIVCDCG